MNKAIECESLRKSFGSLNAVDGVTFELEKDKIYGLIGRNGAGKTTLLHLLTGQYAKDEGKINIFGQQVFENSIAIDNICFVKEKEYPLEGDRVEMIFRKAEIFYKNWDNKFKDRLVKEFDLNVSKKYKNLSRGMKSSVSNIIGLASRAPITIFDEPSFGLDAAMRDKFYNILLEDYQKNKRTIILSTHLIDEVSNLFEEVIIIDKGKILIKENVEELTEKAYYVTGNDEALRNFVQDKKVLSKEIFGNTAIIAFLGVLTEVEKEELRRVNAEISRIPLQKLFIYLTDSNRGWE